LKSAPFFDLLSTSVSPPFPGVPLLLKVIPWFDADKTLLTFEYGEVSSAIGVRKRAFSAIGVGARWYV